MARGADRRGAPRARAPARGHRGGPALAALARAPPPRGSPPRRGPASSRPRGRTAPPARRAWPDGAGGAARAPADLAQEPSTPAPADAPAAAETAQGEAPQGDAPHADDPRPPRGEAPAPGAEDPERRDDRRRRGRRGGRRWFGREIPDVVFEHARYTTFELDSGPWRVGSFPLGTHTLHMAVNLSTFEARAHEVKRTFLVALAAVLLLSGAGGWWVARRALLPVTALGDAAEQITAVHLDRRIPEHGADEEFARLIKVFNAMLERLQGSYLQAVRFSADASHELKTPLAVIQGEVETALGQVADGSPAQAALGSILEEIQRLKGLMHALLVFSRLDAGTLQLQRQPFDLADCVRETCEDSADLAPELRFTVECPEALPVEADPSLLPSVVRNLIGNASKYNAPDGWVQVTLTREGDLARLRVANSGPVIAPEHQQAIFERFFRADPSRTGGGHGLGLALAREFARAHGGEVSLVESGEAGTVFELTLAARGEPAD
ncbi:MAG: HAMP domain-containing sensor histidine kinase [Planctomycetota bacterium]